MSQRSHSAQKVIVLGPQRHVPIVRPAVEDLCGKNERLPVAFISAGWEERETEDGEFREHMARPVVNLEIWGRVERIFEGDPELLAGMRQRHDQLRQLQELYRLRLEGLVAAAQELHRRHGEPALLDPERRGSIAMLQTLDREHVQRIAALHSEFDQRLRPGERDLVVRHRRELAALLDGAACLCIAGGHVGVLLHRLHLFAIPELWGARPLVLWSAGAMAMCERVVLFHQHQGGGVDTEVMEAGLSVLRGIVPLPHARKRLDLHDHTGLQLLALRLQPDHCILLDDGCRIDWDGQHWRPRPGTRELTAQGRTQEAAR